MLLVSEKYLSSLELVIQMNARGLHFTIRLEFVKIGGNILLSLQQLAAISTPGELD